MPTPTTSLESSDQQVPKPRLVKLIVRNYRCIGTRPVEIDLNDIVVLVGANNVGKSSILKAYQLAMSQGSALANLALEDFPDKKVDEENLPEIELHTVVYDETVGKEWITEIEGGEKLVKERWIWEDVGKPKREGWDATKQKWSGRVPWGAPNVANSRRPEPHRVDAFDSPENQVKQIIGILMQTLKDRVKNLQKEDTDKGDYQQLLEQVKTLQKKIVEEASDEIDSANKELTTLITKVFPGYQIDFDAKPEDDLEKSINLFKVDPQLLMGPEDGHMSTIDRQGSGARRTLLWTAIKFIAEKTPKVDETNSARPHVLLIDEPEICLHPNAIRDACKALYDLPNSGRWQVMATTHSPVFVNFSKDNTTIVRVERDTAGEIRGTTVFRPNRVQLDKDDKKNLKLLNICDPYVAEFFFGGRIVVVEGDTEYTAFNYIRSLDLDKYRDVHVIRARGKATIASLIKILNHFGTKYAVLHDSDKPKTAKGNVNPAWSSNEVVKKLLDSKTDDGRTRLLASVPNFEEAYLGTATTREKPYMALKKIMEDKDTLNTVKQLFDALLDFNKPVPDGCIEWQNIDQLKAAVDTPPQAV